VLSVKFKESEKVAQNFSSWVLNVGNNHLIKKELIFGKTIIYEGDLRKRFLAFELI
jgi:hypothetical protein